MLGDPQTNVGDIVTPYLYEKLGNGEPIHWTGYFETDENVIYGAGSILSNFTTKKNVIIWGSGVMNNCEDLNNVRKILAVRGPITRNLFMSKGVDCPEIYGDPALCLPKVYPKEPTNKYKLGIIPHFVDYNVFDNIYGNNPDVNIINVRLDVENFIDEVCKCDKIMSTSLHGLIISHAYSIPAVAIKIGDRLCGDGTKFIDYKLSVGLDGYNIKEVNIDDKDIAFLLDLVNNEPQPDFPINTDKIWDCCPFR